jgi:hypothetical protein
VELDERVRLVELDIARIQTREIASKEALEISRNAYEHAQANSNEWRKENLDQRALFPTTEKVEAMVAKEVSQREALAERIGALETIHSSQEGRGGAFKAVWTQFLLVAGLAAALGALLVKMWK